MAIRLALIPCRFDPSLGAPTAVGAHMGGITHMKTQMGMSATFLTLEGIIKASEDLAKREDWTRDELEDELLKLAKNLPLMRGYKRGEDARLDTLNLVGALVVALLDDCHA